MNAVEVFANVNGSSFVGIDTRTTPTLTGGKKNPMQGRVQKIQTGSTIMVFQNKNTNAYNNMVQRRLVAEGKDPESFVLGERRWGVRIPNTPFISHKGELYLEVIFLKAGEVSYTLDGRPIAVNMIQGLKERPARTGQGGLDNQVEIRVFKLSSLYNVRIDKVTYAVSTRPAIAIGALANVTDYDVEQVQFETV